MVNELIVKIRLQIFEKDLQLDSTFISKIIPF